jgi:pyridoxine 5-phosphate synthase
VTRLAVNIDHVATIRAARRAIEPDPVAAAVLAELAGAHGITVHLRGDQRHIKDSDLRRLRAVVTTKLNVEMAATDAMIEIALDVQPDQVTLVPERPNELTTEGGLNVKSNKEAVESAIQRLQGGGINVSIFIDPDLSQLQAASALGVRLVELNTGKYAEAAPRSLDVAHSAFSDELNKIVHAAEFASNTGLRVLAGHGLTYRNVQPISDIPQIEELNIGHNIIARAALVGITAAVREMLSLIS